MGLFTKDELPKEGTVTLNVGELREVIREEVRETINEVMDENFKPIHQSLKNLHSNVDAGFDLLDDDRKDLAKIKTDHANIIQFFKELLDIFPRMADKISRTVKDTAVEAIESATEVVKEETAPVVRKELENYTKRKPALYKRPAGFFARLFVKG